MKNFFSALLWFLVLFLVAHFVQYYFVDRYCGICHNAADKQIEQVDLKTPPQKLAAFMISDIEGNVLFEFPTGFVVKATDSEIKIPESMNSFKDSIYKYLNENQDKELLISAKYLKSEGEPKGLDRANFLKRILTNMGLNEQRIIPKAVLSDYNYDEYGEYGDGIAMLFQNIPEEAIDAIEKSIAHKTLYAKFGTKEFKADATLQAYAYELKSYLSKHPDKNVLVIGHTDNIGNSEANKKLGLERAQNVVVYLTNQGIAIEHIKADSKGESEPIASNDTKEGRAKNRRITINVN